MDFKLKPNETLNGRATLAHMTEVISRPSVTMVRLVVPDPEYVLGYHIIASVRLEGTGLYNMRIARRIVHRDLTMEQAVIALCKLASPDDHLISIIRPVVTKRRLSIGDLLAAVGRA